MLQLELIRPDAVDWPTVDSLTDRVLFQTRAWVEFVAETQHAKPVVARLHDGTTTAGWFTGLVLGRLGARILGSPFPGWTTPSMGFNLEDSVSRRDAVQALIRFAWRDLGCVHVELKDRHLSEADVAGLGLQASRTVTYEIDLAAEEDELLGRMSQMARRNIRAAGKKGLVVEEAAPEGFADEYYAHLVDVYRRQGLEPSYGIERPRALVRHLHPTGNLLLLRTRSGDGATVATGIFPAFNGTAYFWGGASKTEYLSLRPNEVLFWEAMRRWRARGVTTLDTGGGGEYKRKYGVRNELNVPHFSRSRLPGLMRLRNTAERVLTRGRR